MRRWFWIAGAVCIIDGVFNVFYHPDGWNYGLIGSTIFVFISGIANLIVCLPIFIKSLKLTKEN